MNRTTDELAADWRCTEAHITSEIRHGRLRATKVAGRWLISDSDARAYLEERASLPPVATEATRRTRRPRARSA